MLKSEITGSVSPLNQIYMRTIFRNAWENGGLVLFDECGLAPGAFLNVLNSALEQKIICFPDGQTIKIHENCFLCFADNSTLYGNDSLYPERTDVGGAFRDRLTYVEFPYDEALELQILIHKFGGSLLRAQKWHNVVKTIRRDLANLGIPIFASPRFAYKSAIWFQRGLEFEKIMSMELYRGQTADNVNLVKPHVLKHKGEF